MSRDPLLFLADIAEACDRIVRWTASLDRDDFVDGAIAYSAVLRELAIIGEAVKLLPDELRASHDSVSWREIAGLRDVLVHDYFGVREDLIWHTATVRVSQLLERVSDIIDASPAD